MHRVTKKIIFNRIDRLGLNTGHFESRTVVHDNFFRKGSRYTNGDEVKKYLVKKLGWRYECNECKNVHFVEQDGALTWMNKPVVLQLDHINGDHDDNRLDNLRFLCALCHSQTSTFCGRNNKKYQALQKWLEDGRIQQCEGQMIKKPSPQHI
jgi:ribosomal protein L44E